MAATREWKCLWYTWLLLIMALVVRLVLSSRFLLVPDEANYWQWSRYLALGYHDHPPLIAWTIWLSTTVFGNTEFAVRLPTILGLGLASLYLMLLSRDWFSCRTTLHVILLFTGILLFNGSALIATPDGLLLPCWAAAIFHAQRAIFQRSPWSWLFTGIWFGLGMLAKYTMALFLLPLLIFLLITPRQRAQLASWWPWLGLLLGLLLFSPVLYWNSQHGWATFRHVLYQGGVSTQGLLHLKYLGEFLGTQALLLSPLVFLLLLGAWAIPARPGLERQKPVSRLLFWMSLVPFLVFMFLSLHVRVYGNWPAPAYLAGLVFLVARYGPGRSSSGQVGWGWRLTVLLAWGMTVVLLVHLVVPVLPLSARQDRIARETTGWKQMGRLVGQAVAAMPRPRSTFIFGLRYQYASLLAFYGPGQPRTVCINRWGRPNVYDFWNDAQTLQGQDGVGIVEHRDMALRASRLFERTDQVEPMRLYRTSPWKGRQLIHTLYLVRGYGFHGSLRWHPRQAGDIRATPAQAQ